MAKSLRTSKHAQWRMAALTGSRRQVLAGLCGRVDSTRSDTTHLRLFVVAKYRQRHAVRSLFYATTELLREQGKTRVVAQIDTFSHGYLVCVHCDDAPVIIAVFAPAKLDPVPEAARETGSGSDP